MLYVMTMNVWILLTILFSTAAGHFLRRTVFKLQSRPDSETHVVDTNLDEEANDKNAEPLLNDERELTGPQSGSRQFLDCNRQIST
jgi:hypothetical protein